MPGKDVQLATTVEDLTKRFNPVWIKDGQPKPVNDAYFWDYFKNLVENHAAELVAGVMGKPYISLQKPTQNPEARTTNKTVVDQLNEFNKIKDERKKLNKANVYIQNPAEYAALQKCFTKRLKGVYSTNNLAPNTINPLDSQTYTRFINLPLSADGDVPDACFNPDDSQLQWFRDYAGFPDSGSGFRLSVRVEV